MRRRLLAAFGATVLVVVGLYLFDQLRFPADRVRLAGTPATLRAQGGVDAASRAAVADGVKLMQRYLDSTVGGAPRGPVEVRLAHGNPCAPFAHLVGATSIGIATPGRVCIDTAKSSWAGRMGGDALQAKLLAAHEYAHVWQAERGCYRELDDHTYQWLFEGMAEHLAWRALIAHGGYREAQERENLAFYHAADRAQPTLRAYERKGDGTLYARWHLAVNRLVAGAPEGERGLLAFCRGVRGEEPWAPAFRRAFGVEVETFYAAFDGRGR